MRVFKGEEEKLVEVEEEKRKAKRPSLSLLGCYPGATCRGDL